MARGGSGRVVIEVDPKLKHNLYVALAASGSTLKDWFVREAERHCANALQPPLFPDHGSGSALSEHSFTVGDKLHKRRKVEPGLTR